ncbi:MAG: hypothetical protein KDI59_07940, partial [Xanthomonadales bacterium]|nr:hypothetical protein [Xanthomonadales bacterium]
ITRTKKLRLILLPFTLGFIPEFIRVNMISFIKKISSGKTKIASEKIDFDFDENDIYINKNDKNSINLFVIGKKATS